MALEFLEETSSIPSIGTRLTEFILVLLEEISFNRLPLIALLTKAACQNVLDHHLPMFFDKLGEVKGVTAKFHIKAHTVPYVLWLKIWSWSGVIRKRWNHWASPAFRLGSFHHSSSEKRCNVRICGYYKLTLPSRNNGFPSFALHCRLVHIPIGSKAILELHMPTSRLF